MSDTITEEDLRRTTISFSYTIYPVRNIISDLSALIGDFCEETIGSFYPRVVSKKANVVLTELVNNAIENSADGRSKIGRAGPPDSPEARKKSTSASNR